MDDLNSIGLVARSSADERVSASGEALVNLEPTGSLTKSCEFNEIDCQSGRFTDKTRGR